jgi:hypothetical protein
MIRSIALIVVLLVTAVLGGCTPSAGPLGSIPAVGSAEPSVGQPSPDFTPGASPSPPASSPSPPPSASPTAPPEPTPTPEPGGTTIVRAYFFLGGPFRAAGLVPVLREVPETRAVATAAMTELLAGPNAREQGASPALSSTIPAGTRLLGISISGGVATVDLSGEFESGGGSASTLGRLGQVVYTLTQFPTVDRVAFRIDGRPVTVFGSEGIILDGPVGRSLDGDGQTMFEDLLPAIFVDRAAWGAALGNPGRVTGTANVFEAAFTFALLDGSGRVLADGPVMATCGTGCRGTFDFTIRYSVARAQWGILRVIEGDESGRTAGIRRDYPIWLTPAG